MIALLRFLPLKTDGEDWVHSIIRITYEDKVLVPDAHDRNNRLFMERPPYMRQLGFFASSSHILNHESHRTCQLRLRINGTSFHTGSSNCFITLEGANKDVPRLIEVQGVLPSYFKMNWYVENVQHLERVLCTAVSK